MPAGFTVKAHSNFNSAQEVIDAAMADLGALTASSTAQGGVWNLALAGLSNAEGIDPDAIRWPLSKGGTHGLKELMAGGVDIMTGAQSETKTLIGQGELKGLGYMHSERMVALPDIPTTTEQLDSGQTLAAFLTVSDPEDMDPEIACAYETAALKIMVTLDCTEFNASIGFEGVRMGTNGMNAMAVQSDKALDETITAIGPAKIRSAGQSNTRQQSEA